MADLEVDIEELDSVALREDVPEHRIARGAIGVVAEKIDPDSFEVEFIDEEYRIYAEAVLRRDQLIRVPDTVDGAHRLIRTFFASVEQGARLARAEPELMLARTHLRETPLHYLAVENQSDAVRALVELGAEVNVINLCGGTPLTDAASLGYVDLTAYLLSHGALLQVKGQRESAIHGAAGRGSVAVLGLLLQAGADVNEVSGSETPLHAAVRDDAHLEAVRLLLGAGADVKSTAWFGATPLQIAEREGAGRIAAELRRKPG